MELHPILEEDVIPKHGLWYVVSAFGDRPSLRVGHTCTASRQSCTNEATQKVVFIGGANPSETFSDVHILDLETLSWNMVSPANFAPRYEHISYTPESKPEKVYVLVGADQEANIAADNVQYYDTTNEQWSVLKATGTVPNARTHHTTASIGDCTYLFSGGKVSSEPVQDRKVYCFDASTNAWSSLDIIGDSPSPRHGHSLTAVAKKVYCFGGMAVTKFYNDVHVLDLEKRAWVTAKSKKREVPEPRAAHAAVACETDLYIFGGMNKDGVALSDLWKLDTITMQWTQCLTEGAPPACRLDMASCVITWSAKSKDTECQEVDSLANALESTDLSQAQVVAAEGAAGDTTPSTQVCRLLLIHGGMDTEGEIFDDCLVYRLS